MRVTAEGPHARSPPSPPPPLLPRQSPGGEGGPSGEGKQCKQWVTSDILLTFFLLVTVKIIESRPPLTRGRERGMGGEGGNASARSLEYF